MKKFEKVLLVSDFDGTLNDDNGAPHQSVYEAVKYFCDNGGLFTLSSGRTYQAMKHYDTVRLFNAPALLCNGSVAYDFAKKEFAFFDGIDKDAVDFIRDIHNKFPDASIEMYAHDATFAINLTEKTERHFTSQSIPFKAIEDPSDADAPWGKVMIGCTHETTAEIQRYIAANYADPVFLPTTGSFIEVLKKGVNKGTALLKLADCLSVPHDRAYSIGDGYNDVDMLVAAKAGFVPCNGSQEALRVADYVVRSNNDGAVTHAIEILDSIY
ncbi:MAG: HAD-IIB family hydrolase [Clostridia bacterium]|nr:HAD-IIB family hydrolase [Clostridia bacterium]